MPSREPALESFDVFDTLITRALTNERAIATVIGRHPTTRELTGLEPADFAHARLRAYRVAQAGRDEPTLAQVYDEMCSGLGLAPDTARKLAAIEQATELRLSRPLPGTASTAPGAPRRVAISDTPLPSSFVESLLRSHGHHLDAVHTSAQHQSSKRRGQIFATVAAAEGVPLRTIRHHGDSAWSDQAVPRAMGIQVRPANSARLTRYEAVWDSAEGSGVVLGSRLAAAARLTRLRADPRMPASLVRVVTGVAAPALTAYVLWALQVAVSTGRRRLDFLARDGEILEQIAARLVEALQLPVETHLLHCGRGSIAASLLGHDTSPDRFRAWLGYGATLEQLLSGLGVSRDIVEPALLRAGMDASAPANASTLAAVLDDVALDTALRDSGMARGDRLWAYLLQQGVLDNDSVLVDCGWQGGLLNDLADFVQRRGATPVPALLFGFRRGGRTGPATPLTRAYLVDEIHETGLRGTMDYLYAPFEVFCASDSTSTGDYRWDEGSWQPDSRPGNPALGGWPLADYRRLVHEFVDELVTDPDLLDLKADLRGECAQSIALFWERPTPDEARLWGSFVFERDPLGKARVPLARPLGLADLAAALGLGSSRRRPWVWRQGSVSQSRAPWRRSAQLAWRLKGWWASGAPIPRTSRLRRLILARAARHRSGVRPAPME